MVVADYIIKFLADHGIKDIFLVSGGGIMYLLDSVGRNKKINYICNNHEQACATAAEAYARVKNSIGVCMVTTGPGGTNAITGVAGAWVDSIPLFVISGQVKRALIADYKAIRQCGPQEINIIDMVKPITKYAKTIMKPESIRYEFEKAFYLAQNGRPGPVWLNIPLDVQGSEVNEKKLVSFIPPVKKENRMQLIQNVNQVITLLSKSQRPILILGHGIRLAHAETYVEKLVDKLGIPVLVTLNGIDLIPHDHTLFVGHFGPSGQRRANFALQNTDLILSIGASLNIASTGFDFKGFAPKAKKVMVNIDAAAMEKSMIDIDMKIQSDAQEFIKEFLKIKSDKKTSMPTLWIKAIKYWKQKYPLIIEDFYKDKKHVNSYVFMDTLSGLLTSKDILVTGMGLDVVSFFQVFKVKKDQRAFVNKNFGQMGWCLPAAVGACIANNKKRTILVTGDGSIQFNLQELGTIAHNKLPIKIFIFNNQGYKSIRDTQSGFFEGRYVGANFKSGLSNPNFKKLAETYNIPYADISNNYDISGKIMTALKIQGPSLFEVNIDYNQTRIPKASSYRKPDGTLESRPLHDMFPFLSREEIQKNMNMFNQKVKHNALISKLQKKVT